MENFINLNNLTDNQKTWLSQISYLDISLEGKNKIQNGGLKVSELKNYIEKPNSSFNGDAGIDDKVFISTAEKMINMDDYPTMLSVVDSLIACGLGDLVITDSSDQKSGFQALAFKDPYGNVGISYRGSDFDLSKGGLRDWLESDFLEYFKGDSTQSKEALEFFEKNKSGGENNFLYGHSLGGNLVSHVYLEKYNEISNAFTINGNPINQNKLDTKEKLAAFNDPNKYSCNIICGDMVGQLKDYSSYQSNVNYIKNNRTENNSLIYSHMIQSATFNEDGSFSKTNEEEMKNTMGNFKNKLLDFVRGVREGLNSIENKYDNVKEKFQEYKNNFFSTLKNKFDKYDINYNELKEEDINQSFKNAARNAEMEEIEKIKQMVNSQNKVVEEENSIQNYGAEEAKTR